MCIRDRWWISYTPGVAMFVTRVSRGRKIKEVIWGLLLGSTAGCWFFFGVMESYAMHQFVNGVINVPQVMQTLGGETAVQQVLMSLPAGKLFLAAYLFVMIVFLASQDVYKRQKPDRRWPCILTWRSLPLPAPPAPANSC